MTECQCKKHDHSKGVTCAQLCISDTTGTAVGKQTTKPVTSLNKDLAGDSIHFDGDFSIRMLKLIKLKDSCYNPVLVAEVLQNALVYS